MRPKIIITCGCDRVHQIDPQSIERLGCVCGVSFEFVVVDLHAGIPATGPKCRVCGDTGRIANDIECSACEAGAVVHQ